MLSDRLIWRVKDASIQKKLLSEPDLILDRAIQVVRSTGTAKKNLCEMDNESRRVQYISNGKQGQWHGRDQKIVHTEQSSTSA